MSGPASQPSTPDSRPEARFRSSRLAPAWVLATLGIAALVLTTSLLGLLAAWPYALETDNWRMQAQSQDLGNLLAVAALMAGVVAAGRGSLCGLLVWAGSLLYLAYAFAIYALTVHFGPLFLPYLAVLGLTVYALVLAIRWPNGGVRVERRPLVAGSVVIAAIAMLFGLLWLGSIVPALLSGRPPAELVEAGLVANPVHVLDLALVLPGMLVTTHLARKGRSRAQALLGPWLVFSALMAASVTITLVLAGAVVPAVAVGLVAVVSGAGAAWVIPATRPAQPVG